MRAQGRLKLKRTGLAAAALVAVVGGAAAVHGVAYDPYAAEGDGQFLKHEQAFVAGSTLELSNANGYIVVRSWDRDYLMVKAVKHLESGSSVLDWFGDSAEESADGDALFDEVRLSVRATDTGISVRTHLPAALPEHGARVQYDVMVPRHVNLDLDTGNGHITVMDVNGEVSAFSENGRVTLTNVYGSARARTSNGNVLCKRVSGDIHARAENGSIHVVHHDRVPLGQLDCATRNGKIEVELRDVKDFLLDARTENGRVISDFPQALLTETVRPDRLQGRLGAGGPEVKLQSASGTIRIANG